MKGKAKSGKWLVATGLLYVLAVAAFSLWSYVSARDRVMGDIDRQLLIGASAIDEILTPAFHDRALDATSIPPQEHMKNLQAMSAFTRRAGFVYAYTAIRRDGNIYLTSSNASEEEMAKQEYVPYFELYSEASDAFRSAFNSGQPVFVNYEDRWGKVRSGLVPRTSPQGRRYVVGVDFMINHVDRVLTQALILSLAEAALLLGASLPMFLVSLRTYRRYAGELERVNENLSITLDSIGDGVIVTDCEGRVMRLNPVAEKMTGWAGGDAVGRPLSEVFNVVNAKTRQSVESPVDKILRQGQVVGLANHTLLISRGGEEYQIADSGAPIRGGSGRIEGVVLVFRDVTAEYALQEQLRQQSKMQAIGVLTGGIAHDFNNLLTAIQGNAELLRMRMGETPCPAEDLASLDHIISASGRAAELTRQLLTFARKGQLHSVPCDLHEIIHDACNILVHTLDKRVDIRMALSAELSAVEGDPSQLESALLNLGLNARDAMPHGGTLTFGSRLVDLDEAFCQAQSDEITPGRYIEVTVADTGVGMDAKMLGRIFEPFFTTKSVGKGTGLGLAMVYGCMKMHRGIIRVESEVGKGTTFRLLLPLMAGAGAAEAAADAGAVRGVGHVLVVDDEPGVRAYVADTLTSLGYTVSTCVNGAEAVDFFRRHSATIDLVLMDMTMPKLSGPDALGMIQEIDPTARVLLISGYGQEHLAALEGLRVAGCLSKPIRLLELSKQVAQAIAAPRGGA